MALITSGVQFNSSGFFPNLQELGGPFDTGALTAVANSLGQLGNPAPPLALMPSTGSSRADSQLPTRNSQPTSTLNRHQLSTDINSRADRFPISCMPRAVGLSWF